MMSDFIPSTTSEIKFDSSDTSASTSAFDTESTTKSTSSLKENEVVTPPLKSFSFSKDKAMKILPLSAYIEPSISYFTETDNTKEFGEPIRPLPLRTQSPSDLTKYTYDNVQSCKDMPHRFPVTPYRTDKDSHELYHKNVHNKYPILDPQETAPFCPVDADPFLPWIHDVFPSSDGTKIHFIAQNKRRCNQGKDFGIEKDRLVPQVSIMQHISLKRLTDNDSIPSSLWKSPEDDESETRYRLSSMEDSDPDAKETRFLCRFKTISFGNQITHIGTTPSTYPFNYEYVNHMKRDPKMLTKEGFDKGSFWLSNFQFDCPLPASFSPSILTSGFHLEAETQIPRLYVDVIPVRTGPRRGIEKDGLLVNLQNYLYGFNTKESWGDHVLPLMNASGRWENIPICSIPEPSSISMYKASDTEMERKLETEIDQRIITEKKEQMKLEDNIASEEHESIQSHRKMELASTKEKPNYLVGCLWASASYRTRGNQNRVFDTADRLVEWLEFHFMVGFDHIYIYDNTAAHFDPNDPSPNDFQDLSSLTDLFPDKVTRIEWPFAVCNNNIPAHENTGERSSQYAAESSCRARYGPHTEWMASFDTDEYLIPMGEHNNLKDLLKKVKERGTNILSFRSTRAMLNRNTLVPFVDNSINCKLTEKTDNEPRCHGKDPNKTFLETYNCDVAYPKPKWADRAKKQIYRPSYVLSHFVHYSTVNAPMRTASIEDRYHERAPSEVFVNEETEAMMLHAKQLSAEGTSDWKLKCHKDFKRPDRKTIHNCRMGNPFPMGELYDEDNLPQDVFTEDGYKKNCVQFKWLTDLWVPKLKEILEERKKSS